MLQRKGFTLLELIIVIVVIGILISFVWPKYTIVVEKSRVTEAKNMLSAIRHSQIRYYAAYYTYATNINSLDILRPILQRYFTYLTVGATSSRVGRATRTTTERVIPVTYIVYIDENGNFSINDSSLDYLL
ncbi:MAG: prepilin-type N-terminal cleavage/methylation domain-containing protein [Candidatus Omnitrophica bacterium]|nr:prepilin-type N-terminal cleavage/methylation domain-containing protein [Candidatus Omnitrophota bacterium]MDD5351736.1 prepilin-type N-terminal cleavage/methylation domain-containing protein [Candidatus Omnitrophota bacterium]MDD5550947.1 prepilin-type N-terminal cleavage/methylation domain-containing protein [Candidatus Omnitrophota bacterium]